MDVWVVFQLKSDRELDKLKGLKLVELWLERNPLSSAYKDQTTYIRSVRHRTLVRMGRPGGLIYMYESCAWLGLGVYVVMGDTVLTANSSYTARGDPDDAPVGNPVLALSKGAC